MLPLDRFFGFRLAHTLRYQVISCGASVARHRRENRTCVVLGIALALIIGFDPAAGAQAVRACGPDSFRLSNFMFPGTLMQNGSFMQNSHSVRKGRRPHDPIAPAQRSTTNMTQPRTLAASYYSVRDHLSGILMLSNQGPNPMDVNVTLYSLRGEGYAAPPVTLAGNEVRGLDLNAWVQAAGPKFEQGSLQVSFTGMYLELGGVVRLTDTTRGLIFDEELVEPDRMFSSSRLEGVWWLRSEKTEMELAVSNVSGSDVTTTVSFSTAERKISFPMILNLKPHETRVLDAKDSLKKYGDQETPLIGGISIRHSGAPGAVIARGYVQEPLVGFSNVVEFYDPATQKSAALDGVGLRIGQVAGEQLTQVAVARNVGSTTTNLTGRLVYTTTEGTVNNVELPVQTLAPGQATQIDLGAIISAHVPTTAASLGLEFQSSAGAGSVVMSALSVSPDGQQVFRVPLINAASLQSSTGTYPWSIDETSSTFVYLKNSTSESQMYTMHITYDGGDYSVGEKTLAPGQTLALDIRKLRDEAKVDVFGKTLPQTATHGHVHWSFKGLNIRGIIGRAEQVDLKDGLSMTSSCGACCGDTPWDGWLDPDYVSTEIYTNGFQFTPYQENEDCYGNYYSFVPGGVSWDTSNHSVAAVNSDGIDAVGAGSAQIYADWTDYIPVPNDEDGTCSTEWGDMGGVADFDVSDPPPNVQRIDPPSWSAGTNFTLHIYGNGFGTNPSVVITDSNNAITYSRGGASDTEIDVSVTISASDPAETATITVTSTGYNGSGFICQLNCGNGPTTPNINVSVNPIAAPTPQILFNGSNVAGTTQAVAIGQQIQLSASVSAPVGITSETWSSNSWSSGTVVANYNGGPGTTHAEVTQFTATTGLAITFYWTSGGNGKQVTFNYCMANNQCNSASVTFNVDAPTSVGVVSTWNKVISVDTGGSVPIMEVGTAINDPGITIAGTATPPSTAGKFFYVQTVSLSITPIRSDGTTGNVCNLSGLDNGWPYQAVNQNNQAVDAPGFGLVDPFVEFKTTFNATMYYMWQATNITNAIPVPLGHTIWSWNGDARKSGSWSLLSSPTDRTNADSPGSTQFPTYAQVVTNDEGCSF